MKLTKHQECIVDKIIDGKVYDITTYLKEFGKAHRQKYNLLEIKTVFDELEKDKSYSFVEHDGYYYTLVHDKDGKIKRRDKITDTLTYQFREYPLEGLVKAELNKSVRKQTVQYQGQKYVFDFEKDVLVADSFEDVKDFIALWCYLKNEALIFDVKKTITDEDIGIFFELNPQKIEDKNNPTWGRKVVIDSVGEAVNDVQSHDILVPYKDIDDYMDSVWQINLENLNACEEFMGRKILSTGALKVYKQKNYKTVEELSVKANLRIAIIAVIISVISVLIGNIIPLFQKQDTEYLDEISKKISVIEKEILIHNSEVKND